LRGVNALFASATRLVRPLHSPRSAQNTFQIRQLSPAEIDSLLEQLWRQE
jgi:hypothetical protein